MTAKVLLVAIALFAFAAAPVLHASQDIPVVIAVTGDPKIMKKGSVAWTSCGADMAIGTGDRVKTSSGEDIQISFAQKANFVKINENSDVVLLIGENGGSVDLLNGEALALVMKLPEGSTFEIKTPSGISGARGTGWGAKTRGARATFNSFERSIYVKGIDKAGNVMKDELTVREGLRTTVDRFDRPERLERLSSRDMERWSGWKDSLRDHQAREREAGSKGAASHDAASGNTDKDGLKEKFERVESSRDRLLDKRESQKQEMLQNRDADRIERRMERRGPPKDDSSCGQGSTTTST